MEAKDEVSGHGMKISSTVTATGGSTSTMSIPDELIREIANEIMPPEKFKLDIPGHRLYYTANGALSFASLLLAYAHCNFCASSGRESEPLIFPVNLPDGRELNLSFTPENAIRLAEKLTKFARQKLARFE